MAPDSRIASSKAHSEVHDAGAPTAAEAYLEAQQYQLADSARLARDLLEDLLAGKPPTVEERQLALAQMGLADDVPLVALVATLPAKLVGVQQRARLRAALTAGGRGMVVARHHEVVALLPVGASARRRWWRASVRPWSRSSPTAS